MYEHERLVAIRAAENATEIIEEYDGQDLRAAAETGHKSDDSLVTEGDDRAQAAIVDTIREHFPEDDIVAEETLDDPARADTESEREWVIDPIDGTANFSVGLPFYVTSVALRVDGQSVVGVVASPRSALSRMWVGVRGEGAVVSDLGGHPEEVETSTRGSVDDCMISTRYTSLPDTWGADRRELCSAALLLCLVAEGRLDAYVIGEQDGHFPLDDWDWAAGGLILREAGGRLTHFSDGRPLVASNGTQLHDRLLDEAR